MQFAQCCDALTMNYALCTMRHAQYALCSKLCAMLYKVHSTLCTEEGSSSLHFALCMHPTLCTLRNAPCAICFTKCTRAPCTLQYTLCTMHSTLCTEEGGVSSLHFALCITMHFVLCTMQCIVCTEEEGG